MMFLETAHFSERVVHLLGERLAGFFAGCLSNARPRTHGFDFRKVVMSCVSPLATHLWHTQARADYSITIRKERHSL